LDYNPLFVLFCHGLKERKHPFVAIVKMGLLDLLNADGAFEKIMAILNNIVQPLRLALMQNEKVNTLAYARNCF
jgi:hypothetical protein